MLGMKNRFLDLAIAMASRMAGRPARLISLAARLVVRLDQAALRKMSFTATRQKLSELGRLLSAYARGEYRRIPGKVIISITAALLYFMNPFDLIPDALPALGLTDDLAVLSWVYQNLSRELSAFREWEQVVVGSRQ
jgi:uncharacterized membrane protein YkvA (DUF1232 family)